MSPFFSLPPNILGEQVVVFHFPSGLLLGPFASVDKAIQSLNMKLHFSHVWNWVEQSLSPAYLQVAGSKRWYLSSQMEELSWQRWASLGGRGGTGRGRQSHRSTSISQSGIHEVRGKSKQEVIMVHLSHKDSLCTINK